VKDPELVEVIGTLGLSNNSVLQGCGPIAVPGRGCAMSTPNDERQNDLFRPPWTASSTCAIRWCC
jgi:hypothetical protein